MVRSWLTNSGKPLAIRLDRFYGGIVRETGTLRVLTTIKGRPRTGIFGGIYPEAGLMVRQAKEIGLKAPFMSGDGTIDPKFIEIAGAAAEGTYLTFSPDPSNIPTAKEFVSKYRAKYGELGPYSIYAYDAANIMLAAIKEANSTEGKLIMEKLHSMEFSGALGMIKFDARGDVTAAPYVVWITKGGKFMESWKP
jgi:branched-chain amino acid transport system substrate-binding protein